MLKPWLLLALLFLMPSWFLLQWKFPSPPQSTKHAPNNPCSMKIDALILSLTIPCCGFFHVRTTFCESELATCFDGWWRTDLHSCRKCNARFVETFGGGFLASHILSFSFSICTKLWLERCFSDALVEYATCWRSSPLQIQSFVYEN